MPLNPVLVISHHNCDAKLPSLVTPLSITDLSPFSDNELLTISNVKDDLREYYIIPEGKEDASLLNANQISLLQLTAPVRFHNLDFSLVRDDFIMNDVISMRTSRQESPLSSEDIPLSVKALYTKLRDYCDMNREGRVISRYRLDSIVLNMKRILPLKIDVEPMCLMLSREWLIWGSRANFYDDDKREVMEDRIGEGYDSLMCMAI